MALNKYMNIKHTPTRIEKTGNDCNICGECLWTEHEIILHMDEHMRCIRTNNPFVCKLCGLGLEQECYS